MTSLHLFVSAPICGFRVAQARSYWETYLFPPPSTVNGMLLSLIGEPNRLRCEGAEIAVALLESELKLVPSVVLRTMWRFKGSSIPGQTEKGNTTPDYQELLTHIRLSIWVRPGEREREKSLAERLRSALENPETITRYGGLSLGESTHLVDEVRRWRESDTEKFSLGWLLVKPDADREQATADMSLPVWPDHVGSKGTRWGQFALRQLSATELRVEPPKDAWITVRRPGSLTRRTV